MWWWQRIAALEQMGSDLKRVQYELHHARRDIERLEADLREVRSTQNVHIIARQHEGQGLAALLMEQAEPELTEEEKRLQEEQKQFLSFLGRYQGDNDA